MALICDASWKRFINIEQSVLFVDQNEFLKTTENKITREVNENKLEEFLEQLDDLEVSRITQTGDLFWGKWILSYLESFHGPVEYRKVNCNDKNSDSIEIINQLSQNLKIDLSSGIRRRSGKTDVFLDPYEDQNFSQEFLKILSSHSKTLFPQWLRVVVLPKDKKFLMDKGLEDQIIDRTEMEINLLNQPVLCFSDRSSFALTSRSYNVALYNTKTDQGAFIHGDIHMSPKLELSFSGLIDILNHWRTHRLQEMAFGCLSQGIDIHFIENSPHGVIRRNLLPHPSLLRH